MSSDHAAPTLVAEVATASPLDAATRARLVEKLSDEAGQAIELDERIEPTLIGGIRVRLGGRLYDGSVVTQMKDLRSALMSAAEEV